LSSIVWLASYPKSGNTWMRAFLHNYLENASEAAAINSLDRFFANENMPQWYQGLSDKPLDTLSPVEVCALRSRVHERIAAANPGTVLVKTHNFQGVFDGYPLHNIDVTAGAIYVVRNPLDLSLSVADHFGFSLDEAIEFVNSEEAATEADGANMGSILGSWSFHVASWTDSASEVVRVVRYEDMLEKPIKAFSSVLALLGLERNTARIKRAIKHSSFETLKKQEARDGFRERSPHSQRFFRRGRMNQWRTELSPEQVDTVVAANREQMRRFNYIPRGY
jgi:hypothetical protein